MKPCQTIDDIRCCYSVNYILQTSNGKFEREMCLNECPLECEYVTYITSVSTSVYPSSSYADGIIKYMIQARLNKQNVSLYDIRNNMLAINVYYSKLNYKSYQESAKTEMVDLVSNIGGTIGLFLGVSFLSFIEIIDLFFHLGLVFYNAKPVSAVGSTKPLPK